MVVTEHMATQPAPLRVLFVNRMAGLERGGGETFDLEISRHLQTLGVSVTFLVGAPLSKKPPLPIPHAPFYALHTPYLPFFPWDRVKGGWRIRQLEFEWFEYRAAKWIERHASEFDIIQICELPNLVFWLKQRKCATPVVMRLTAPNYYDPRKGIDLANAVIASGASMEKLRTRGLDFVKNIPNAVDENAFDPHPSDFRKKMGIQADELIVLYVARFQAFKNHGLLLQAFAELLKTTPHARLLLAGDGPLKPASMEEAKRLGILERVNFLGHCSYETLPEIYAAADVMAISSDYESFCFAALEAMASGLPIVTTDCGWVPKLVEDGAGLVVPLRDPHAFAHAMQTLAADPALRKRMGTQGRKIVLERHRWQNSAEMLKTLYDSVLGR